MISTMVYKEKYNIWVSHKYELVWSTCGCFSIFTVRIKKQTLESPDMKLMWERQLGSWRQQCLDNSSNELMKWVKDNKWNWNIQFEDTCCLWEQHQHRKSVPENTMKSTPLWELQFLCGCGSGLLHRVTWKGNQIITEECDAWYILHVQ